MSESEYRSLPAVDAVMQEPRVAALAELYSWPAVTRLVRDEIGAARETIRGGGQARDAGSIADAVARRAESAWGDWPARVVNATGVVLHTNLGRAPLSKQAIAAATEAASGYSDLEFDLRSGERGSRQTHVSRLLADVTGAEAGMAVNNNASAVLLALSALAAGKEVIVSRGEAVEIGGGFRVPDVMRQSGARLVEVGTTNRTYASDYESAITSETKAILKVHPSNFTVSGFTHTAEIPELVEIGARHGVPVLNDLGSGSLIDTRKFGIEHEPTVQESVDAGAGLTLFSGDKLLGGPQAGLIAGARDLIDRVARHPLARAVRIDKMTLAALNATLLVYLREAAETEIPIWRMIAATSEDLQGRAERWRQMSGVGELASGRSAIGGGSLPGQTLPTTVLSVKTAASPDSLAAKMRQHTPPVVARIQDGAVLLDPRTVLPEEDEHVVSALAAARPGE